MPLQPTDTTYDSGYTGNNLQFVKSFVVEACLWLKYVQTVREL